MLQVQQTVDKKNSCLKELVLSAQESPGQCGTCHEERECRRLVAVGTERPTALPKDLGGLLRGGDI